MWLSVNSLWLAEKKKPTSQALVAHTCNPSYSGGRDQEDHSLKPALANSSETLSQKKKKKKNSTQKRAGCLASVMP
jgi:hypothetical protein